MQRQTTIEEFTAPAKEHIPSGQGEFICSKYYLLDEEIHDSPDSIHEEITLRKIEGQNGENPMYLCRKDFYGEEDTNQMLYYGHPLYDTIDLALEAYQIGRVQHATIFYLNGTVEFGFARELTYPSGSPVVVITWIDGSTTGVSISAISKIETTPFGC